MSENVKICTGCKNELPATVEFFYKSKKSLFGVRSKCKECESKKQSEFRVENLNKIRERENEYNKNRDKTKRDEYITEYNLKNKDKIKEYQKKYSENNKVNKLAYNKDYKKNNKFKIRKTQNIWYKNKMKNDHNFSMNKRISLYIYISLNKNKNGRHWESLVGYTLKELISHLESTFLPGMSWDVRHLMHIDHIKPLNSFKFTSYDDIGFKQAWALNNLQMLWAKDNIIKSDKWNPNQQDRHGNVQTALIM